MLESASAKSRTTCSPSTPENSRRRCLRNNGVRTAGKFCVVLPDSRPGTTCRDVPSPCGYDYVRPEADLQHAADVMATLRRVHRRTNVYSQPRCWRPPDSPFLEVAEAQPVMEELFEGRSDELEMEALAQALVALTPDAELGRVAELLRD